MRAVAERTAYGVAVGLPAVRGQKSVRIVYQQSVARFGDDAESAVLIDPTRARKVVLTNVPPRMRAMRDPLDLPSL